MCKYSILVQNDVKSNPMTQCNYKVLQLTACLPLWMVVKTDLFLSLGGIPSLVWPFSSSFSSFDASTSSTAVSLLFSKSFLFPSEIRPDTSVALLTFLGGTTETASLSSDCRLLFKLFCWRIEINFRYSTK